MSEVLEKIDFQKQTAPALATVAVVGLGYVGLPVAVAFGKHRRTIGYDLSKRRVENLKHMVDTTGEVSTADLIEAKYLKPTAHAADLQYADFIIVAVPTPINAARQPDLSPLESASEAVGRHMKQGATVIYESTVYPGATEEVCVPILEKASGMRWKQDFHVGYSPGAHQPRRQGAHASPGSPRWSPATTTDTLEKVAALYGSVVKAGVYRASSIRVAEAAKVIENTQRDLNIAFVNELAIIFEKLGLDTVEVLKAAGTKWNFLPFRPGLVGGHCIGVDPYYLTHKAELLGYHPQVILAGRRINDSMGSHIARKTVQADDPRRAQHQGRARQRARAHLQGGRARHPQLQGRRHPRRAARVRRRGASCTTRSRAPRTRCTSTASSCARGTSCRRPTRSSWRCRTSASSRPRCRNT